MAITTFITTLITTLRELFSKPRRLMPEEPEVPAQGITYRTYLTSQTRSAVPIGW